VFESLFNVVLVIVISIYMLLDADRLSAVPAPPLPRRLPARRPDRALREGADLVRARADHRVPGDRRAPPAC
jgi:predicted PurR-regulated permease PerM